MIYNKHIMGLSKLILLLKDIPRMCKLNYKSYKICKIKKCRNNRIHPIAPLRGEIYDAYISEGIGKELCGRHPVVIIQNKIANLYSDKVTILPIEGDGNNIKASYQEKLTNSDLEDNIKLKKDPSRIITSDIITIDKVRLGKRIGKIKEDKMFKIDKKIKKQLNLI